MAILDLPMFSNLQRTYGFRMINMQMQRRLWGGRSRSRLSRPARFPTVLSGRDQETIVEERRLAAQVAGQTSHAVAAATNSANFETSWN